MVLDKSSCVLVPDILGTATGDVQLAMSAIANLAAAELHPGGKDGEVICYFKMVRKAAVAAKVPFVQDIAVNRIVVVTASNQCQNS